MSFGNFNQLSAEITAWIARDDSEINSKIADFITLAEAFFNRNIRAPEMSIVSSITVSTTGQGDLPDDYLEWIAVEFASTSLRYADPDSEEWKMRYRPRARPQMFTIRKSDQIIIRPGASGTITLFYYAEIPALTSSANWLLTKAPDLYLHMSLFEAYMFQKDEQQAAHHWQIAQAAMDKLTLSGDANKVAKRPARNLEFADRAGTRAPQTGPV